MGEKRESITKLLNGRVFWLPAVLTLIVVVWGFAAPASFASAANAGLAWVLENFNWFLVPLTFGAVLFCLWSAFSRYGKIRLGGEDAQPKVKTVTWFAISLCSGMGIGITYFATYQPLELFYNPPAFLENVMAGSEEALTYAMRFSFLEWGFHPYALYTCFGIVIAFMFYNGKRRYRVSDGLYPLLGDRVDGIVGDLLDCFAIFVIIGGLGASAGTAIMQVGQGCQHLFGVGNGLGGWLVLTVILAAVYILGSATGIHKWLSWFGNANLYLYVIMMVFALFAIDGVGVLEVLFSSIGDYIQNFIGTSLYLEPLAGTGWVGANNTFFFTWWMVFAPFTGLFLIKLAYGRTLREFVLVNMIVPAIFVLVWFSVFGGGAILWDTENGGAIYATIQEMGPSMAWYALFDQLPISKVTNVVAWIIVTISFVTLAESLTMSLASMSCKGYADTTGETQPPKILCVFWGVLIAAVSYMLLYSGGRDAIETVVVICGLPTGVFMLAMMLSHIKAMRHYEKYDLSKDPTRLDRE